MSDMLLLVLRKLYLAKQAEDWCKDAPQLHGRDPEAILIQRHLLDLVGSLLVLGGVISPLHPALIHYRLLRPLRSVKALAKLSSLALLP